MTVLPGKILIVYDEPDVVETLSYYLKNKGYFVISAKNRLEAMQKAQVFKPGLILVDVSIENSDAVETIRELSALATIFVIGYKHDIRNVDELDNCVRYFIPKPVKPEMLLSKVESAMRPLSKTVSTESEQKQTFGELVINQTNYSVFYKGQKITLAKKEFELLSLLASKPGRVFFRNEILQRVWGVNVIVSDRTIDVHIRKIRRKIGIDVIKTVIRVGYKFQLN